MYLFCFCITELDPKCPAYYGNRAAAYMMKKEYNKALDDARTANSLDPSFTKGYIRAAKCYIATGQTNNALQALHQAKELEPKNKAILDEVWLLFKPLACYIVTFVERELNEKYFLQKRLWIVK